MRLRIADAVDAAVRIAVRARAPSPRPRSRRRGVLLVSSGGLGDTILFSVVAPRFLNLAEADEPVDLIVRTNSAAAGFLYPPRMRVRAVDYRRFLRNPLYRLRTSLDVSRLAYRVALSTDHLRLPGVDDALVTASGADERYAMTPRSWPKHDTRLARNRRYYSNWFAVPEGMSHRMVRWTDFANWVTGRSDPMPVVRFDPERLPAADRFNAPTVVVHPFSAIRERQHPYALFAKIVAALPSDHDVVLSAGPGDLDRNPEYRALASVPRVRLDEGSLEAKAAALRGARFVVTVDTSVMHLAVGTGVPTLCLASAAHVVDSVPYDSRITPDNVRFLYHDMPCRGCLGSCIHPFEDGMYPCVARLDANAVMDALADMIAQNARA
jgi:ADP-heptose:LPS heptosyltransferase